jgi:hypothetical protein
MRKWVMLLVMAALIGMNWGTAIAGSSPGPAPNSGDGIPDGSGFPEPPSPGPKGK